MYGIIAGSDVTRSQYLEICQKIADEIKVPRILPEGITEGGFKVIGGDYSQSPIANDGYFYKSIRHMRDNWPDISDDVETDWKDDNTVLFKKGDTIMFYPKVGKNTQKWTDSEIDTIVDVFDKKINQN